MTSRILILLALIFGVLLGILLPNGAAYTQVFGTIFINLLKLIILPLIFVSCFLAFASVKNTKTLKQLGTKTLLYYILTSTLAATIGIICAYSFLLMGNGNVQLVPTDIANNVNSFNLSNFILSFFPQNFFQSLYDGNIIHIVLISLGIGLGSHFILPEQKNRLVDIAESLNSLILILVQAIIFLSPIGVFSLVYSSIANMKFSELTTLGSFVAASITAALIHSMITMPILVKTLGKISPLTFLWQVKDALIIALSTASSSATLPVSTEVLIDNAKIDKKVVGFVLPLGATLNMDGSALYQSIAVIFMGKLAGIDFTFSQIILTYILVMFSSAGTAGVPGGGIVMITMIMNALGIPLSYVGIYILVDRFMDYPITAINVLGDLVGGLVVGKSFIKEEI